MAKPFEQEVLLDVAGQPIYDAMTIVQRRIDEFAKTLRTMGKNTVDDVKNIQTIVDANIKALKQARSDLKTLQEGSSSTKGKDYAAAEKAANAERLIQSKVFYGQELKARKEAIKEGIDAEIAGAKLVSNTNAAQLAADKAADRQRVQSAKEVKSARLEAAQAGLQAKARGITNVDDARGAKIASDQRLASLRAERQAIATTDSDAARGLAERIALEKTLGRELDSTIRKLNMQSDAANRRIGGLNDKNNRLLVGPDVQATSASLGASATLGMMRAQQTAAQEQLRSTIASKSATVEQGIAAQKNLEIANLRVAAAQRLVNEENKVAAAEARQAAQGNKPEGKSPLANVLSPGYALTAFARTSVYGLAAAAAYGLFNAVSQSIGGVIQLEDELAKLQAISNSTDTEMQSLKGSIYAIGAQSRFATADLVKIAQTLAQAGVNASEMTNVLKSVTTLATASGSTPDEAVQLVTSALGSFQLQGSEAARVADLLTNALNRTKLTVGQVAQAIQYVGATAYEQNITLETMLATVGAIAQGGVRSGSTIGTGFRQFLVDLQTPSEKLTFQLERLGITQADVNVKTRGLAAVLETLKEKGFGATQAYDGLETRAAAFYLVAKNNVDVMDDLQLSFALSGAAAIANERSMNSLTAQWQRFKNILQEGFAGTADAWSTRLKNILRDISDAMVENEAKLKKMQEDRAKYMAENQGVGGAVAGAFTGKGKTAGQYVDDAGNYALEGFANTIDRLVTGGWGNTERERFGTWIRNSGRDAAEAGAKHQIYADAIKSGTEEVEKHTTILTEADKEMGRLKAQQSDLINNQRRAQSETVTLSARFGGLVKFLGTTKNAYLDLINAMNQYRGEESRFLAQAYAGQVAAQQKQNNADSNSLSSVLSQVKGNAFLMGSKGLTAQEKGSLGNTTDVNFPARMAAAAERLAKVDQRSADLLNDLATLSTRVAVGGRLAERGRVNGGLAAAAATPLGIQYSDKLNTYDTQIGSLGSMDQGARTKAGTTIIGQINSDINKLTDRLSSVRGQYNQKFVQETIAALKSQLGQVTAAIKPTADELKKAKADAADRAKADREASRRPKVTQADLDKLIVDAGGRLGSGTRTPAQQEDLHRRGLTPARGFGPHVSDHVNVGGAVARDSPTAGMTPDEVRRFAARARALAAQRGIEVDPRIETGRGRNQGSGPHVHFGVRPGARMGKDREAQSDDKYAAQLAQDQVALDEENLKQQLKELTSAMTKEAFDSAVTKAKTALDQVNAGLRKATLDELAVNGIAEGSATGKLKIAQMEQSIAQNIEEFQTKVSDAIIKSVQKQIKAAQTTFDAAIEPAETALKMAQAQATGLESFSLRNKIPDYVKVLAQNRIGQAAENVDRARYDQMGPQIAVTQAAIQSATAELQTKLNPEQFAKTNAEIMELNLQLKQLVATREALGYQLNAGGLIPDNVGDALTQAVEAWRSANSASNTFSQDLIKNMGGAIETISGGLTQMFTSILDGSQSALGAFASFAKGIMQYIQQMVAKIIATKILDMLFKLVGIGIAGAGGGSGGTTADVGSGSGAGFLGPPSFKGGPSFPEGMLGGGEVTNGSKAQDSVTKKLARGEWVVNSGAVDSVGNDFMANLNRHGSKALDALAATPQLAMQSRTEVPIYIIPPEQKPSLGKDDVLLIMTDDMMNGGSKRLIKNIARDN